MHSPLEIDLIGDRAVAFNETITRVGENWTGATFKMQVRVARDASGSPLVSLSTGAGVFLSYGGSATLAAHIAAGRLTDEIYDRINPFTGTEWVSTDVVPVTILLIGIDKSPMSGPTDTPPGLIPPAPEPGEDWIGVYDLLVDPDGASASPEDKYYFGKFRVRGTVVR